MRYIITEQQYNFLINEGAYNSEIAKIQQKLVDKGYYLGKYGPNLNGVDGILGSMTKRSYEKEYGKELKLSTPESPVSDINTDNTYGGGLDAILIGGLDYRDGDLDIDTQVKKFEANSNKKNVKGFRYNTPTSTILNFLKSNPNVPVYMFSAGCTKSNDISQSPYVDKNKIFIIEPFASSSTTKQIVQSAVSNGVPAKNVFVGPNSSRGAGVVDGASPSNANTHWDALKQVASIT
jgi:hypothetical protein